ncbi:hypothetical protein [Aquimarina brevivitae]|uniref:Hydrolase n=1 Tax=Aquimarina brevivitae TaxID=323412 RepID=A0A4Q7P2Q5_9FLAO|nr:hypothetical protein [Aquimarina brevivitae]RZS93628.1 hypothetical protein EV197_2208 [Aquimarina brevivitae]
MKGKIFMYLFIFTALFVLFQFMNAKKAGESYTAKISNLENQLDAKQQKIDSLVNLNMDLTYFRLDSDEEAIAYIEEMGYDVQKLERTIVDQLLSQNKAGEDNPIVPYAGMEGSMAINKIRLLNHKWIIADFTDGVYWGQLLILFDVREDGVVDFEVIKAFLYPRN